MSLPKVFFSTQRPRQEPEEVRHTPDRGQKPVNTEATARMANVAAITSASSAQR
jgi:hypothetical protein